MSELVGCRSGRRGASSIRDSISGARCTFCNRLQYLLWAPELRCRSSGAYQLMPKIQPFVQNLVGLLPSAFGEAVKALLAGRDAIAPGEAQE